MEAANADIPNGGSTRIWEVIDHLETNGLTTSTATSTLVHAKCIDEYKPFTTVPTASIPHHEQRIQKLTSNVANILKEWGDKWAGQPEWQTLLSKKSLLHEVEESIVSLNFLLHWLESREETTPITLVDVCCGKGILSMLASYVLRNNPFISEIIMLDKQTDINWNHIHVSNQSSKDDGRPTIQTWGGCNLNEIDSVVDRLEKEQQANNMQYALIGIHLCKLLSPSCVGLANSLGQSKCPYLCLAPCCMPRAVLQSKKIVNNLKAMSTVSVRTYETREQRKTRREANALRAGAKKRTFRDHPCYLCADTGHPVKNCALLPNTEAERIDIFQKAAAQMPCWKCGQVGHVRADCTSTQESSKPPLTLPPTVDLDVSLILKMDNTEENTAPFQKYCELLATSIDKQSINVYDVGLVNQNAEHNNPANQNNWNRDRKSIYIVATSQC